jgi:hypothetical protein
MKCNFELGLEFTLMICQKNKEQRKDIFTLKFALNWTRVTILS